MRRADRLFRLIQYLRGRRRATTARDIADALEVSVRTVYRDIADLAASGVPIDGEAGVGYVLRGGFDLPPLMFDVEEIEALVLGVQIVGRWGDPGLAAAARRIQEKVEAVLPENLRDELMDTPLFAPPTRAQVPFSVDLAGLRHAIRDRRKVQFSYTNEQGRSSTRTVRPLGLAFYGPVWLFMAWCELRDDFRAFRVDRMTDAVVRDEIFMHEDGKRITDYIAREEAAAATYRKIRDKRA